MDAKGLEAALEADLDKFANIWALTGARQAMKDIQKVIDKEIDNFYSFSEPDYYNRVNNIRDNGYIKTPMFHSTGSGYEVGYYIQPDEMFEYEKHGVPMDTIHEWVFDQGAHGRNRPKSGSIIEKARQDISEQGFLDKISEVGFNKAKKAGYTLLRFY